MSHEDHTVPPSDPALRIKAIETLMVERGVIDPGAVAEIVDIFQNKLGPRIGAKVVARAWADQDFKRRLLANGTEALKELDVSGLQGEAMIVLENTPQVHNVIVCTLCSCYPWTVLGLPPTWYKSAPYRSRIVIEPRAVLAEFGLKIGDDREVRVYDSNAEIRYMVLPMRPDATEGWTEEKLVELVTRDSMIGTGIPLLPNQF
ncbi:nitrile hydratase subunit alpha [Rhizobium bangladeshense]|uniref:nitrile hydratase subunit alpha n=1 Tax=Rhizobium bangladeshense TaxID=1138189 RepID=UPI001C83B72A|nr:nitrile hydratase subunit alpha [Rhizobium bangladeshense]MBX4871022.1 nitrile hydratase subunit alpha [Rhizobium bangladeshense]MBX4871322.1 nitrile hydratase subunit alpha [Rhizobium bangladeshense]MBX4887586.1 nitrile hydratase subunit alpha [Rhizobium bangladeshense]